METRQSNKRKSRPEEELSQSTTDEIPLQENEFSEAPSILNTYMANFKKFKSNSKKKERRPE